jgi:hypothetical protein
MRDPTWKNKEMSLWDMDSFVFSSLEDIHIHRSIDLKKDFLHRDESENYEMIKPLPH